MEVLDSSLWIDYFRAQTRATVKAQIDPIVRRPDVVTCEFILFELLRAVPRLEARKLEEYFETIPMLETPPTLWRDARRLGQKCVAANIQPHAIDLLIAQVCLHHEAQITTFDVHFEQIRKVAPLSVILLDRAVC
jgi:predicted nucleic acid-binding protein